MTILEIKEAIDDVVVRYEDGLITEGEAKNLILSTAWEACTIGEEQ